MDWYNDPFLYTRMEPLEKRLITYTSKAKAKKVNPRKIPKTQADVERAVDKAVKAATVNALTMFLTVLLDKENADEEALCRVWHEIEDLSGSIAEGYVSIADLKHVLKTEYNIFID